MLPLTTFGLGAKHETRDLDSVSGEENPKLESEEIEVELKKETSSLRCDFLSFFVPTVFLCVSVDLELLLVCFLLLVLIVVCL